MSLSIHIRQHLYALIYDTEVILDGGRELQDTGGCEKPLMSVKVGNFILTDF